MKKKYIIVQLNMMRILLVLTRYAINLSFVNLIFKLNRWINFIYFSLICKTMKCQVMKKFMISL